MVMACSHSSHFALPSDEELAGRASVGSRHATELLLARYRPLVESKARAYFLMGADHDDVVQEGMIGLYKAIRDFRAERLARFRAFADLCVTRQIISAVKTATRQKHAMLTTCVSLNQTSRRGWGGRKRSARIPGRPPRARSAAMPRYAPRKRRTVGRHSRHAFSPRNTGSGLLSTGQIVPRNVF